MENFSAAEMQKSRCAKPSAVKERLINESLAYTRGCRETSWRTAPDYCVRAIATRGDDMGACGMRLREVTSEFARG